MSKFSISSRTRSWLSCGLLIASFWRAPVPWIHVHETTAAGPASGKSLSWHLRHFHSARAVGGHFGWHVHLTFPWDVSDEPCRRQTPTSPKPASDYDMPFVVTQAPAMVDLDRAADPGSLPCELMQQNLECGHLDATCVSSLHFMQTYPPGVALRALICVARC